MTKNMPRTMQAGMMLMIAGSVLFVAGAFIKDTDLGPVAGPVAFGLASTTIVYSGAESAIKKLQTRITELEESRAQAEQDNKSVQPTARTS